MCESWVQIVFLNWRGLNWIRAERKLFLSPPPSSYTSPPILGGLDINSGA